MYNLNFRSNSSIFYKLPSQIAVKSRLPHSMPPLFAHKYQCKHRQRNCKIDKGKGDPGILEANFSTQLYRVESDAEAENLAAKVEQ